MNKSQQPALCLFAVGLIALGILALRFADFALVWQPVPASLPGRTALAYASGVLMLACGIALFLPQTRFWSARILFPYFVLWTCLKLPDVIKAPGVEASWLGFGELTLLLSGGWTLFACLAPLPGSSPLAFLTSERALSAARILFAISIIPVGLSHIVYLDVTAGFVPAWLPFRKGWAVLTGAGQIGSGLGVLFNVLPRIAAYAEAAQISIYTLLVWAPALLSVPNRLNFTAFFISWIFGAAAWAVAQNIPARSIPTETKS